MLPINTADELFHNGSPATGELGTVVTAEWLNGVQGEILAVLAAAGIEPTASNVQLLSALHALFAGLDGAAFTAIPTAPTATPGTANESLSTTEFVSVAIAALGASQSLEPNGHCKLPGGLYLAWATGQTDATGKISLTSPITFPTALLGGIANEAHPTGWTASRATVWSFDLENSSRTTLVAHMRDIIGTAGPIVSSGVDGRIFAWGK